MAMDTLSRDALSRTMKALADPTRLEILALLARHGELCVCDVERVLRITQSKTSRHLRYLEQAGLLQSRRDNVWMYYRIDPKPRGDEARAFEALRALVEERCSARWERRAAALLTERGGAVRTCAAPRPKGRGDAR
ncbi:MAG: winged helix-turn-helix transcriptional regulator [Myxococcales bacterium]|nr:winged helix-turn-helix transcriptional regulator [Myxococcales bacterium]